MTFQGSSYVAIYNTEPGRYPWASSNWVLVDNAAPIASTDVGLWVDIDASNPELPQLVLSSGDTEMSRREFDGITVYNPLLPYPAGSVVVRYDSEPGGEVFFAPQDLTVDARRSDWTPVHTLHPLRWVLSQVEGNDWVVDLRDGEDRYLPGFRTSQVTQWSSDTRYTDPGTLVVNSVSPLDGDTLFIMTIPIFGRRYSTEPPERDRTSWQEVPHVNTMVSRVFSGVGPPIPDRLEARPSDLYFDTQASQFYRLSTLALNDDPFTAVRGALRDMVPQSDFWSQLVDRSQPDNDSGVPTPLVDLPQAHGDRPVVVDDEVERHSLSFPAFVEHVFEHEETYLLSNVATFWRTREPLGQLSNFNRHLPVILDGQRWQSSEALYQALKFPSAPDLQQEILDASTPREAKAIGSTSRSSAYLRGDWDSVRVDIMRWVLHAKVLSNWDVLMPVLGSVSVETPLVEYSRNDRFWGAGGCG